MSTTSRIDLPAEGLTCAGDAPVLARKLEKLCGVVEAHVNPMTEIAYVDFEPGLFSVGEAVEVIRAFGCRTLGDGGTRRES
ncbi:MAG: hypothetical protein GWN71_34265 [Gammaproteobacteria bacterium]|nr:heavy-metal-associated domain-containing protein [Gemmatimonadota bacterium]NIU78443.1 hypothetical protein [Gammaproteobacteria bacterium]NIQ58233.1 heavy-metal-associated domain-containing protein [Gemmatimonadota bacterium]NIT89566.1 heavy-metal-associated domain-containing protein [Gemmatimonadota bacterium]NIW66415.1 hypothetical protein [Gemmatimonadota bacterium]